MARRRSAAAVTLPGAVFAGALAGAVGTAAMDAVWYLRHRRQGGTQGPLEWEFSAGVDRWDGVSAPGQVGKRLLEVVVRGEAPDTWARTTQNVVHWATGVGWGAQFGVVARAAGGASWTWGLALGPAVWLASYVVLPLAKVYKPVWEYDATTLAKDLSAHMAYGVATGAAFAFLVGRR